MIDFIHAASIVVAMFSCAIALNELHSGSKSSGENAVSVFLAALLIAMATTPEPYKLESKRARACAVKCQSIKTISKDCFDECYYKGDKDE